VSLKLWASLATELDHGSCAQLLRQAPLTGRAAGSSQQSHMIPAIRQNAAAATMTTLAATTSRPASMTEIELAARLSAYAGGGRCGDSYEPTSTCSVHGQHLDIAAFQRMNGPQHR
jgi:hypothetical protein